MCYNSRSCDKKKLEEIGEQVKYLTNVMYDLRADVTGLKVRCYMMSQGYNRKNHHQTMFEKMCKYLKIKGSFECAYELPSETTVKEDKPKNKKIKKKSVGKQQSVSFPKEEKCEPPSKDPKPVLKSPSTVQKGCPCLDKKTRSNETVNDKENFSMLVNMCKKLRKNHSDVAIATDECKEVTTTPPSKSSAESVATVIECPAMKVNKSYTICTNQPIEFEKSSKESSLSRKSVRKKDKKKKSSGKKNRKKKKIDKVKKKSSKFEENDKSCTNNCCSGCSNCTTESMPRKWKFSDLFSVFKSRKTDDDSCSSTSIWFSDKNREIRESFCSES